MVTIDNLIGGGITQFFLTLTQVYTNDIGLGLWFWAIGFATFSIGIYIKTENAVLAGIVATFLGGIVYTQFMPIQVLGITQILVALAIAGLFTLALVKLK